jgi:nucleotide-binding universal stress UspA family protein
MKPIASILAATDLTPASDDVVRSAAALAKAIIARARTVQADLVVLATRGQGALERALLGSVASGVARRARCPVLLVPPTPRADPQ